MMNAFVVYLDALVSMGHDRDWIRRNHPALRQRFDRDREPFPCFTRPEPVTPDDRYEEL